MIDFTTSVQDQGLASQYKKTSVGSERGRYPVMNWRHLMQISSFSTLFFLFLLISTVLSIPISKPKCPPKSGHALDHALSAVSTLQSTWYSSETGLWSDMWWNSANCLTTIAELHHHVLAYPKDEGSNSTLNASSLTSLALDIYQTTFVQAPLVAQPDMGKSSGSWLNNFYDDEAWWALAWLRVFDVTGNRTYLRTAQDLYSDLKTGIISSTSTGNSDNNSSSCPERKGGLLWQKGTESLNAIENVLFLELAAQLAQRTSTPANSDSSHYNEEEATTAAAASASSYLSDAAKHSTWLLHTSGLVTADNLVLDTLTPPTNGTNATCPPTPTGALLTYNAGPLLSALVALHELSLPMADSPPPPSPSYYLSLAASIAQVSMTHFSDDRGILVEKSCDPHCDTTAAQFKGILMRGLAVLQGARPSEEVASFIEQNAWSIWGRAREGVDADHAGEGENGGGGRLGSSWAGPYVATAGEEGGHPGEVGGPPTRKGGLSAMCSGLDGLVAAVGVQAKGETAMD